MFIMDV